MEIVNVLITRTTENFCAHSDKIPGCVATGSTIEEVKDEYAKLLDFHLEGMETDNEQLPVECNNYKLVYSHEMKLMRFIRKIFKLCPKCGARKTHIGYFLKCLRMKDVIKKYDYIIVNIVTI